MGQAADVLKLTLPAPTRLVLESVERRRLLVWIFTAVLSRHRFVYPVFRETTQTAIEACEEAWVYYGGIFRTLIPDNTKTIVQGSVVRETRTPRSIGRGPETGPRL
jgi:transposase